MVALEPSTGKVLVMVSTPSYDPNNLDRGNKFKRLATDDANSPLVNRATQAGYPPGSTFKAVTATAALDSGKFKPDSTVSGKNGKKISGVPLNNFGGEDFGDITLTDALTHSVNTVWAEVGEKLGKNTMAKYMLRYGFYKQPPIDLPDDQLLASGERGPNGKLLRPRSPRIDVGRMAIGQDKLLVTPLQMATVAATIANGGVRMEPHITQKIVDPDGRTQDEIEPKARRASHGRRHRSCVDRDDEAGRQGGHGHGGGARGRRAGRQDRHRGDQHRAEDQRPLVHRLHQRLRDRGRAGAGPGRPGRRRGGADRQAGARGAGQMSVHGIARDTVVDERYKVLNRIGSGGMADVYCAEDLQLGRRVALKLLYRRFAEDEEFVERFRREASSAAGLQHPNVVAVFDRGEFDGTYYIAMEFLEGRSLKQLVRQEGALEPDRAIDLVIQILKAARFAHRRGIVHRDIKPHNVIVDDEGRAKVTDFGIARAGASDMTETGSIMGTAQYLSPEQAQGHPVDARADLYSIGVVLYELLTGRVPFDAESAVTIALKQVSEEPVPPSHYNPAVSDQLEDVVMRALQKDPAFRFADAEEFIVALEQARGIPPGTGEYTRIAPHTGTYPGLPGAVAELEAADRRNLRWLWWLLLAAGADRDRDRRLRCCSCPRRSRCRTWSGGARRPPRRSSRTRASR